MFGTTDRPIESIKGDMLGVEKHIVGLSNFIRACDTPMTIAIQGDWGTGKTSFMNMVRESIRDDVVSVWFNTWQFSQFNLEDSLPVTLLSMLVTALSEDGKKYAKVNNALKKIGKATFHIISGVSNNLTGVALEDSVKVFTDDENVAQSIAGLRDDFQECVADTLKKQNKDRAVVFIDDLDRLNPERAVEVLEILKLFLDCDKCIFVLAIDYDVVSRGVSRKYGEGLGEDKGRSFFDKIIQVPFKMPTAHYQIEKYIEYNLTKMKFDPANATVYAELISDSIGYNPRGMKRIFNAFALLTMIYEDKDLTDSHKQIVLFAVLCLQLSFEEAYNYMVLDEDDQLDKQLLSAIAENDTESEQRETFFDSIERKMDEKGTMDEISCRKFEEFMRALCKAVSCGHECISQSDFDAFIDILKISGTTASVTDTAFSDNGKIGKGIRYVNLFEETFTYHCMDEPIEKTNPPTGWNNCKLDKILFFGKEYAVSNFVKVMVIVLSGLYEKDPEKFRQISQNSEEYGLYGLFNGSRNQKGFVAEKKISDAGISFESKNNNAAKIAFLRKLFRAMDCAPCELKLSVKLAQRTPQKTPQN